MIKHFDTLITAKKNPFKLNIKETVKYKDLIWLFVQRDFKTKYKQTILGPLWFIIQPLLTTFIFTIVFGEIAGLSRFCVAADGLGEIKQFSLGFSVYFLRGADGSAEDERSDRPHSRPQHQDQHEFQHFGHDRFLLFYSA